MGMCRGGGVSQPARARLVAANSRRTGGGSDRGREGLLGPGPDLPAVALFSSAAPRRDWGLRLGLRDWTAPGNPDPSSVQLVRSSHLARAPTTDCEVGAVRGRCPPAALSTPLARISEQVPRSWDRAAGRTGRGWLEARFPSARGTREMPVRGVPGWRRGSVELGCAEGAVERVTVRWAQGLGASADRALSPEWGARRWVI